MLQNRKSSNLPASHLAIVAIAQSTRMYTATLSMWRLGAKLSAVPGRRPPAATACRNGAWPCRIVASFLCFVISLDTIICFVVKSKYLAVLWCDSIQEGPVLGGRNCGEFGYGFATAMPLFIIDQLLRRAIRGQGIIAGIS